MKKQIELTDQQIKEGGDSQTLAEIYKLRATDLFLDKISNLQ
jgi:hypothetical protein